MGLEELLAEQEQLLAAPSVAPSITPSMPTVTAPTSGSEYERRLNDILGRRQALQQQIAGSEQAISAMDILGGLATGVGQGTTLGWGDELVAGARSLLTDVTYEQALAEQQAQLAQAREVAPIATGIGEIGTALLTPLGMAKSVRALGGLKGVAGEVLTGAPRLAGQTLKQTFIPSAISGTVYGAGAAEPGERLSGALVGGGIGGAVPLALSGVASAIGKAATTGARMGLTPQAEVGAALIESGLDPTDVATKVKGLRGTAMERAYTSAQVTQNPLLATLERNLPTNIPSEEARLIVQKIQIPKQAREQALTGLDPASTSRKPMVIADNLNAGDIGNTIKTQVAEEANATKKAASELYKNIRHQTLNESEARALRTASERARDLGFGTPTTFVAQTGRATKLGIRKDEPSDIRRTLTALQNQETYSTDQLIIKRGVLDDLIQKYENEGQNRGVATLTAVRDHITGILESRGGKEWERANAAYRDYAERFVNGVFPNVGARNSKIVPEKVVDKITSNQETAKQFVAQVGTGSDALKQAQRQIVSDLRMAFRRNDLPTINRLEDNADIYKIIFQDNPNAASTIDEMIGYARAARDAGQLVNVVGNSTTANKLFPLVQDFLAGKPTKLEQQRRELQNYIRNALIGLGGAALVGPVGGVLAGALTGLGSGVASMQRQKLLQARRLDELGKQLAETLINPVALVKGLEAGQAALPGLKQAAQIGEQAAAIPGLISGGTTRTGIAATNQLGGEPSGSITPMSTPDLNELSKRVQELLGPSEAQAAVPPPKAEIPEGVKWTKTLASVSAEISKQEPLIQAMIYRESRGNPKAKSKVGAAGLMQLMPGTAKALGVKDVFDAKQNIAAGTKYIEKMRKRFGDDSLALAAYNWGPGNVSKAVKQAAKALEKDASEVTWDEILSEVTVPTETRKYVEQVLRLREQFS